MGKRITDDGGIPRSAGVYFRGCVSKDDNRQLIYASVINNKSDSFGRKIMYLGCSVDGETVIDYHAERDDNFISDKIHNLFIIIPNIFRLLECESEQYCDLVSKKRENDMTALYCRVASSSLLDAGAIESQRSILQIYASQHGFKNYVEYLDNGFSGNSLDRPAFARMNADIQAGKIKTVIVRSVDRVARNHLLCDNWIRGVRDKGVNLVAMDGSHETASITSDIIKSLMRNERRARSGKVKK